MRPEHIIKELESDNSKLFKERVIKREADSNNDIFFEGCRLALDNMITFGIKQVEVKNEDTGSGLSWDTFISHVRPLIDRTCTGNLAKTTVETLKSQATKDEWNFWYRRILLKHLECGISTKTVNKVVKKIDKYKIPVFACQLADDSREHEDKVSGKKLIETKFDGVRVLTVMYPSGYIVQYSRNGKELHNFGHIKTQLAEVIKSHGGLYKPMVLDGEIMSASFQDLMRQVYRKRNANASDAVLYVFDMIPLEDFENGIFNVSQQKRSEYLKLWYDERQEALEHIELVGQELVDLDTEAGDLRLKEINQIALDNGYEGIMLKDPDAPYICDRKTAWLKLKPFIEVTLKVVGFEEGTKRNTGRLGALVCEGEYNSQIIITNVGGGFSDRLRDDIWRHREKVLHQLVEVRADGLTSNKTKNNVYSLRFPRLKCFRGFSINEQI